MFSKFRVSKRTSTEDEESPGLVLVSTSRISENGSKRSCRHRVGRPIHDQKCAGCVKDRQSCVFPESSTRCLRCISRDRDCHPRTIDGEPNTPATVAVSPKRESGESPQPFKSALTMAIRSIHPSTRSPEKNDQDSENDTIGPTTDFILSELIRQIPSLTGKEALTLSQMITGQLRRWNWPRPRLTFRRTKIIENASQASVTVIDFECVSMLETPRPESPLETTQIPQHHYASTLVMSDIPDPDSPELRLGCLWAPSHDGKEGVMFAKEAEHILSVFKQCSANEVDHRDRIAHAMAVMAIGNLYAKHFAGWEDHYASTNAAIQRACAWGIVAAKLREVEYRLFAASLSSFLNFELQRSLPSQESYFELSGQGGGNDICCTLIPLIRASNVEIPIGQRKEIAALPGLEPMVWSVALETILRRGERMIPWRSGRQGSWSLSDRFEEIYLNDYSREQIKHGTGKYVEYDVRIERLKSGRSPGDGTHQTTQRNTNPGETGSLSATSPQASEVPRTEYCFSQWTPPASPPWPGNARTSLSLPSTPNRQCTCRSCQGNSLPTPSFHNSFNHFHNCKPIISIPKSG